MIQFFTYYSPQISVKRSWCLFLNSSGVGVGFGVKILKELFHIVLICTETPGKIRC